MESTWMRVELQDENRDKAPAYRKPAKNHGHDYSQEYQDEIPGHLQMPQPANVYFSTLS